uniref:Elicitin n=1 Tax=Peronospora matthiolae TaxID=2874970 RepID=A0AAV1UYB7_9STRA
MQALLALFVTIDLFLSTVVVKAEPYTASEISSIVKPIASNPDYASCRSESNYTLSAFPSPSAAQLRDFCSSSACQGVLSATLKSNHLPDCEVLVGSQAFNLIEVAAVLAATCGPAVHELDSPTEGLVAKPDDDNPVQRASDRVASLLGHSAPIEKIGIVAALLSLVRE